MPQENKTISDRLTTLEVRVDEIIIPTLKKMDEFIDENRSGIKTASLLDNKIVTTVVYGIVLAGIGIVIEARLGG